MQEILVRTKNPKMLDETVQQFGGVVGQVEGIDGYYEQVEEGVYAVRSVRMDGNIDFLEFAIRKQGYGTIVGKRDI